MSIIGGTHKPDYMRDHVFGDDQLKAMASPDVFVAPEEIRRVESAHQYRAANQTTNPFSSAHFHYPQQQQPPQQSSYQHNEKAYRQFLRNQHQQPQQTTEPYRENQFKYTNRDDQNRIYDLSTDIHSDVQKDLQHSNRYSKHMKRALLNDRIRKFSTVNESTDVIRSDDNDSVCAQKEFNYWTKLNAAKEKEAEATLKSLMTFCAGSAENLINLFDIKGIKLNGLTKRVKRAFKKGRFSPALDQLQIFLNKYLDNPVTSSAVTLGNIIFKTNNSNRKKHIKAKITGQEYNVSSSDTDSSDDEIEKEEEEEKPRRRRPNSKSRSIEFHTKKHSSSEDENENEEDETEEDESDHHHQLKSESKLDKMLELLVDKMDVISKRLDRLEESKKEEPSKTPQNTPTEFRREINHTQTYEVERKGTFVPEEKSVAMNLLSKVPAVADTISEVQETREEVEKAKDEVAKVGPPPGVDYEKMWKFVNFSSTTDH